MSLLKIYTTKEAKEKIYTLNVSEPPKIKDGYITIEFDSDAKHFLKYMKDKIKITDGTFIIKFEHI
jgi:hypothetical protein